MIPRVSARETLVFRKGVRFIRRLGRRFVLDRRRNGITGAWQGTLCTLQDVWFDRAYGVRTRRWIVPNDMDAKIRPHASVSAATRSRPFLQLFRHVPIPRAGGFVDIGAGKGRVMMLAHQLGFRRIVGVECSASLCAIAQQHLAAYQGRVQQRCEFHLVHSDAAAYPVDPLDTVFYFFNPFTEVIMEQVLRNIDRAWRLSARPLWLILHVPSCRALFDAQPFLQTAERFAYAGGEFLVYATVTPAAVAASHTQ